jgi:hypothetical protein
MERWLASDADKTVGGLIDLLGDRSFALLFVLLLSLPALPVPTGGATHVLEVIAVVVALQLIAGRREVWLPERWRAIKLAGDRQLRGIRALLKVIGRLERISRPRLTFVFERRVSDILFGVLVVGFSVAAFLAPPFTGLDTLPAAGVVVLSLGVLLRDFALVVAAIAIGAAGVLLEIVLGRAVLHGVEGLF